MLAACVAADEANALAASDMFGRAGVFAACVSADAACVLVLAACGGGVLSDGGAASSGATVLVWLIGGTLGDAAAGCVACVAVRVCQGASA